MGAVKAAPILPLHVLGAIGGKDPLDPVDHGLVVLPKFLGVGIVLMGAHIAFPFFVGNPVQRFLKKVLPDGRAVDVFLADGIRGATGA